MTPETRNPGSAPRAEADYAKSVGGGNAPDRVAEMQGLFGPISVPERVVQTIWRRGDFRRDGLTTLGGKPLEIVSAGTWNRLDGPDFLGAELLIDGVRVRGDVEIHFYAEDWKAHGHAANPLYGNVVLHVLAFPPAAGAFPRENSSGGTMETFLLLPHLKRDIEEYASEEALAEIEGRGDGAEDLRAKLFAVPEDERFPRLRAAAFSRWTQKVRFMARRLEDAPDWGTLAHRIALETLGLRRNREAMSRLATRFSPSTMLLMGAEKLYAAEAGHWRLAGTRPANLPARRLEQYLTLLEKNPAWARQLRETLAALPGTEKFNAGLGSKNFRARGKMRALRREIADGIFAGTLGGTRLDTLLVDAFLPLASASGAADLSAWWFHWFLGDAPGNVPALLRDMGVSTRERPYCNGLFQGLIQVSLER